MHDNLKTKSLDDFVNEKLCVFNEMLQQLYDFELNQYTKIKFNEKIAPIFEGYNYDFRYIVPPDFSEDEKETFNENMNNIFLSEISSEVTGIVISGINKKTMKNSFTSFEMICNESDGVVVCNEDEELDFVESKIKIFAQNDVINDFFNGIDDELLKTINEDIINYNTEYLDILLNNLKNSDNISKDDLNTIKREITLIKENSVSLSSFQDKMKSMNHEKMDTILNEIEIMPKQDLIQMSDILIKITRLKRIITSERVTVDGNVMHYALSLKDGIEKFY